MPADPNGTVPGAVFPSWTNSASELTGNEGWLVGYWRFDEGSGTIARDSSTKGHDAVLELGPEWVPSGVVLRCP